ncbi:MAG: 3-methyl-2-oxobutanoate hydroxymethyltransferase, partial [Elusimicrobiales bacterium]|nr:3-methyl-2-oxobutanoate hydroxymethyltransferase [Elusimicrobiales bacterium]
VNIATIGIGAGSHTDGQVLVLQDALGLYENPPSFAKKYIEGGELIKKAFNDFDTEVKEGLFPENKNDNNKKSQKMAVCSKK